MTDVSRFLDRIEKRDSGKFNLKFRDGDKPRGKKFKPRKEKSAHKKW